MRRLLSVALVAAIGILIFPFFSGAHASPVGGLIRSDTVWSKSNSPYQLTGPVGVLNGATLTIEPGVTIDFASYYIQVNGTLRAQGTSANNIIFTSNSQNFGGSGYIQNTLQFVQYSAGWNAPSASGSIVENAFFNKVSLSIQNSSPIINRNTFNQSGVSSNGGSPIIQYNIINSYQTTAGISASGSATVSNNYVKGAGYNYGIQVGGTAKASNNVADHCYEGIVVGGQAVAEGNTVSYTYGNGIRGSDPEAKILKNYIVYNRYGISGTGTFQNNAILYNKVGIQTPTSSATITDNNIYGNSQNSVYLGDSSSINMPNNWWGTTDDQAISLSIHDSKSDFNLGTVTYTPLLTQPNSAAPAKPLVSFNLPTPTPTIPSQTSQPINIPTQNPTLPSDNDWLLSIGSFSSGPNSFVEVAILRFTQIALAGLGIGWMIVIMVVINKRRQKRRGIS